MRNATCFLRAFVAGCLLLLAGAPTAHAQNYRPFGPGRTYHYREDAVAGGASELYTFRVDSVGVATSGDSLLMFNATSQVSPYGFGGGRAARINLYGGWMYWDAATGAARFGATRSSATVTLQTRAALGQNWPFAPGVQAAITARGVQTVLGQIDSVLSITLSDSNIIRLSQHYGIIGGPDFTFYLGQTYRSDSVAQVHTLELVGLPETGRPGVDLTWPALVDFSPGDSLFYRSRDAGGDLGWCLMVTCSSFSSVQTSALVVRGRRLSANGDTLIVSVSGVTTAGTGPSREVRYPRSQGILSATELSLSGTSWNRVGTYAIRQNANAFGGLPVAYLNVPTFDANFDQRYAPGLGCIFENEGFSYCCWTVREQQLIGFYKNNTGIRWGNTTLPLPLSTAAPLHPPLPATLAPNPALAGAAALVHFALAQPQPVGLTLYDGVGRNVWQAAPALPAGAQRLAVAPGVALAPGLYRLRLTLADGRQRVLPLVRE